ncbi:Leucine Rich Repeat (LRR)-containing protein [Thiovulum sp. ES]|nr:Leucine Rich Repeat (LRR)-containing protein [Thiovulum sp. ES]
MGLFVPFKKGEKIENWEIRLKSWAERKGVSNNFGDRNKLINLQKLVLGGKNLRELPSEIGNLQNLQTLYLWNNELRELPPEIGNLQNLKKLSFSGKFTERNSSETILDFFIRVGGTNIEKKFSLSAMFNYRSKGLLTEEQEERELEILQSENEVLRSKLSELQEKLDLIEKEKQETDEIVARIGENFF